MVFNLSYLTSCTNNIISFVSDSGGRISTYGPDFIDSSVVAINSINAASINF